jgi:flavin reductase (DIM6/NTAB) family NADH-FMN oxidoreductase RutF
VLDDALAYIDCEIHAVHDGGDHAIVVGKVVELGHQEQGKPLAFYRGGYGRFDQ